MEGQAYSAILPNQQENTVDRLYDIRNQNLQNQRYQQQQQWEHQRYNDQMYLNLANYLSDKFNPNQYLTGTDVDAELHRRGSEALNELAQQIGKARKDGTFSMPDITLKAAQQANDLAEYSNKARAIDNWQKTVAGQYAKTPGVNANLWYQRAKTLAWHNPDGSLKPLDQVDPNTDYMSMALQRFPEDIVGNRALIENLHKIPGQKIGDSYKSRDQYGHEVDAKYSGTLQPYQELYFDNKDGGKAKARIKTEAVSIPVQQADGSYKNVQTTVLDPNAYQAAFSDPASKLFLDATYYKYLKDHGEYPSNVSPMHEDAIKRQLGLNILNSTPVGGGIINENTDKERPMPIKIQYPSAPGASKKESPFPILGKFQSGQLSEGEPDANGMTSILPYLPKATLSSGKIVKRPDGTASNDAYSDLLVDKSGNIFTKELEYKKDGNGNLILDDFGKPTSTIVQTQIKDPHKWIRQIAQANGYDPDKAWTDFSQHYKPRKVEDNVNENALKALEETMKPKQPTTKAGQLLQNFKAGLNSILKK